MSKGKSHIFVGFEEHADNLRDRDLNLLFLFNLLAKELFVFFVKVFVSLHIFVGNIFAFLTVI